MILWLAGHLSTMVVCLVLASVIVAILVFLIRSRKQGKASCGCGCSGCAMRETCHGDVKKSAAPK